jgi:hypothetical protein
MAPPLLRFTMRRVATTDEESLRVSARVRLGPSGGQLLDYPAYRDRAA